MAPTEVLARQHWHTLERYLAHSRVRRLLLTGGLTPKERREALDGDLRAGEIDLVVGTQALVQEDVQFARLGLVVIDEQHKFGVHQRARVRAARRRSALPRHDRDADPAHGGPDRLRRPGRVGHPRSCRRAGSRCVTRWLHGRTSASGSTSSCARSCAQGRQGYVVCPLVEESDDARPEGGDADATRNCRRGRSAISASACCTAGMDEDGQGRRDGALPRPARSICWSARRSSRSASMCRTRRCWWSSTRSASACRSCTSCAAGSAAGRWRASATCSPSRPTTRRESGCGRSCGLRDGFALAEEDARLRGVGEFFGTRQHGLGELRFGDLLADADLLQPGAAGRLRPGEGRRGAAAAGTRGGCGGRCWSATARRWTWRRWDDAV